LTLLGFGWIVRTLAQRRPSGCAFTWSQPRDSFKFVGMHHKVSMTQDADGILTPMKQEYKDSYAGLARLLPEDLIRGWVASEMGRVETTLRSEMARGAE
jgi:hypothetical protein